MKLVEFAKSVCRGYEAFKAKSEEEFEDTIAILQNANHLVGKCQFWAGEFGFTFFYKWKF